MVDMVREGITMGIVKKIDEIRVEENWERWEPKEWMEVIRDDMRACYVDRLGVDRGTQVVYPIYAG